MVEQVSEWPGAPLICVVDDKSAIVAYRDGNDVHGHWGTAPAMIAAARLAVARYGGSA